MVCSIPYEDDLHGATRVRGHEVNSYRKKTKTNKNAEELEAKDRNWNPFLQMLREAGRFPENLTITMNQIFTANSPNHRTINVQCILRKSQIMFPLRLSDGSGRRKCRWCVSGVV